jgi:hypothetical protein
MTDHLPMPWEADNEDEAYALWQAWVDEGADPNEPDWKGYL